MSPVGPAGPVGPLSPAGPLQMSVIASSSTAPVTAEMSMNRNRPAVRLSRLKDEVTFSPLVSATMSVDKMFVPADPRVVLSSMLYATDVPPLTYPWRETMSRSSAISPHGMPVTPGDVMVQL